MSVFSYLCDCVYWTVSELFGPCVLEYVVPELFRFWSSCSLTCLGCIFRYEVSSFWVVSVLECDTSNSLGLLFCSRVTDSELFMGHGVPLSEFPELFGVFIQCVNLSVLWWSLQNMVSLNDLDVSPFRYEVAELFGVCDPYLRTLMCLSVCAQGVTPLNCFEPMFQGMSSL